MTETKKAPSCAICGKPVDPAYKPFCSKRCANVDLHRWLKGSYVIAGEKIDESDLESESPPSSVARRRVTRLHYRLEIF